MRDSIRRDGLKDELEQNGINRKILYIIIHAMYKTTKVSLSHKKVTELFYLPIGRKQGDNISTIFFNLFVFQEKLI